MKKVPKKNLSSKDLSKLKNDTPADVPCVTLRGAVKKFREGDIKEADRLYDHWKDGVRRKKR